MKPMKSIRSRLAALTLIVGLFALVLGTAGCPNPTVTPGPNPAPGPIPSNIIVTAQVIESTGTTIISDASTAWPIILALIPSQSAGKANTDFQDFVTTANHSLLVLNDAIQLANTTDAPNVANLAAAEQAVSDAIAQIVAIVAQYSGGATQLGARMKSSSGTNVLTDMQLYSDKLKGYAKDAGAPIPAH